MSAVDVFERGEDVCEGEQRVDVLYTEADGVWVHLQRRSHYEVKSGHRGWRRVGDIGKLVGKPDMLQEHTVLGGRELGVG